MSEKLVLGYWGMRGRGQALRHLLSYTGIPFEQKIYKTPQEYGSDVASIGVFPNLPYLKDGQFTFTQTLGIARYIARRSGMPQLLGKTPMDQAVMDNFIYAFEDLMGPLIFLFFNKKINDVKVGHYYKIKSQLERVDKAVRGNGTILSYLTIADFITAQLTYYIEKLYPQEFPQYKNLLSLRDHVMSLPQVKAYYERPNAIKTPFLPPNKTAIPFFWPGTEQAVPLPPKNFPKKTFQKSQTKPTEQKQQQKQQQHHAKQPQVQQQNWDQQVQFYAPQVPHRVAVISGSLSGSSSINFFLGVITNIGHPAFHFDWCDISQLQMHNQDIDDGTDNANSLRGQVYQAEAVLIGVSQTKHMVSTALTNAYNWLVPVLKQKPVALVSIESSENSFRRALDEEGIPYLKGAKLSISDPSTFFNQEGGISGPSLNKTKYFFNRLAQFLETGN